jgi:hypothetical protein
VSPRTFNPRGLGFSRRFATSSQNHATDVGKPWGIDWPQHQARDFGHPLFNIAGFPTVGERRRSHLAPHHHLSDPEDVSLLRGNHSFKIGGELRNERLVGNLDYFARGSLSFSGAISGTGISDLLLGFPRLGCRPPSTTGKACASGRGACMRRTIGKSAATLTLNLGVRYELPSRPPIHPTGCRYSILDGQNRQCGNQWRARAPASKPITITCYACGFA